MPQSPVTTNGITLDGSGEIFVIIGIPRDPLHIEILLDQLGCALDKAERHFELFLRHAQVASDSLG